MTPTLDHTLPAPMTTCHVSVPAWTSGAAMRRILASALAGPYVPGPHLIRYFGVSGYPGAGGEILVHTTIDA